MMNLKLDWQTFRVLLRQMGPSLGLWRGAEIAALRTLRFESPIAEVGCGDGLVTSFVLDRVDVGFDPDVSALERARARCLYGRLEPVSVEDSDLPAASVATVVSNSVLEHVPGIHDSLSAIHRLLRPGGRLIFTAPTEAMHRWLMLPFDAYARWRNRSYGHFNLWPVRRWTAALRSAGFRVEIVKPYLCRRLVFLWDALDVSQRVAMNGRRIVPAFWQRLPPACIDRLAARAARLDLSAPHPGGGRLIVARKV